MQFEEQHPEAKEHTLKIVEWQGRIRCAYLDDFRIAGGKPWGGGKVVKTFTVTNADLLTALRIAVPDYAERGKLREALELAANRLMRLELNAPYGSRERAEIKDWSEDARAAAKGGKP
jgi:hypothetical protein